MHLELAIKGDLSRYMKDLGGSVVQGSRKALRITTLGLRKDLRSRVRRARFRRKGLVGALAAKVTAEEGRVYSVARYRGGAGRTGPVDLIQLFEQGTTIRAAQGAWLAIPTGEGPRRQGRGGVRFATPAETAGQGWKTAVIPARGGNMVVVATWPGGGRARVVTHVLIRQTTLRARYDLAGGVADWQRKMPTILAGEIETAAEKRGV